MYVHTFYQCSILYLIIYHVQHLNPFLNLKNVYLIQVFNHLLNQYQHFVFIKLAFLIIEKQFFNQLITAFILIFHFFNLIAFIHPFTIYLQPRISFYQLHYLINLNLFLNLIKVIIELIHLSFLKNISISFFK